MGKEVGKEGTPHLQGFVHLKTSLMPAHKGGILTWRATVPSLARAHLEKAFGTDFDSEKYCEKDGNLLIRIGDPKEPVDIWASILQAKEFEEVVALNPEIAVKNFNQVSAICARNSRNCTSPRLPALLSTWQRDVARAVLTQNTRQITFVVDTNGNSGKSVLAQALRSHFGQEVFYCRGGASANIVHAFSKNRKYSIAIFDYARNKNPDFFAWDLFEELKDGGITSLKYDGDCYWMDHPVRVLVLTNHHITDSRNRLTEDRWDVHYITDKTDKTPLHETIGCFDPNRPEEDVLQSILDNIQFEGLNDEEFNNAIADFDLNLFDL